MPTLFLPCGLPCAGKTTLARRLEAQHNALWLNPDEWLARLTGDGHDAEKRQIVETMQWEIAARALTLGVNVVLDFGVWSRAERDAMRARAAAVGARTVILYLEVPRDELLRRLTIRNANLPPYTFTVTEAQLDLYFTWFEAPQADELASAPVGGASPL